jgi:hypothetical protein
MQQLVTSDIYDAQIKYVPAKLVDSYNYARDIHAEFLDQGYEGSIIRLDGLYKHGRSYDLLKTLVIPKLQLLAMKSVKVNVQAR